MSEVQKVPLFVEVIGEPSTGKTHLSSLFPKPALMDTTAKGEGYFILRKLYPDEWKKRYFRIREFGDFSKQLKIVENQKADFRTIVVDTSADLRTLGGLAHLKELGGDRKRLMPEEWAPVNTDIDEFIYKITNPEKMCMNLVFTSQMQDEWIDRKKTGRRIRKGNPGSNFQADIRLYLQLQQKVDDKTMKYIDGKFVRTCQVIKCRFRDQANETEWVPELKDLSWAGIKGLTKLEVAEIVE